MDIAARLAALSEETRRNVVEDPHRLGESPDEVMARLTARATQRAARWASQCPPRFVGVTLDSLTADQDPGGRVSRWLDSDHLGLVLRGEAGVGKSHAAHAVANAAVDRGVWVQGWTAIDFNDAIRPGADSAAYATAQECGLLLIDDLGRERLSDWTLERLNGVLDARYRAIRRTLITTNLTGAAFTERYGAPIAARVMDDCVIIHVEGERWRRPAPW